MVKTTLLNSEIPVLKEKKVYVKGKLVLFRRYKTDVIMFHKRRAPRFMMSFVI